MTEELKDSVKNVYYPEILELIRRMSREMLQRIARTDLVNTCYDDCSDKTSLARKI